MGGMHDLGDEEKRCFCDSTIEPFALLHVSSNICLHKDDSIVCAGPIAIIITTAVPIACIANVLLRY